MNILKEVFIICKPFFDSTANAFDKAFEFAINFIQEQADFYAILAPLPNSQPAIILSDIEGSWYEYVFQLRIIYLGAEYIDNGQLQADLYMTQLSEFLEDKNIEIISTNGTVAEDMQKHLYKITNTYRLKYYV